MTDKAFHIPRKKTPLMLNIDKNFMPVSIDEEDEFKDLKSGPKATRKRPEND